MKNTGTKHTIEFGKTTGTPSTSKQREEKKDLKKEIEEKYGEGSYFMGVDLAVRLKWWQRFLVWIGFRDRWQDYSCSTVFKRHKDGTLEVVDINYL